MVKRTMRKIGQNGFTLIELIITIAIISIMVTVILINMGGQKDREEVRVVAEELAAQINNTKQRALSGNAEGGVACGFGVNFFDDGSGNGRYRTYYAPKDDPCDTGYNVSSSVVLYTWSNPKVSVSVPPGDALFFAVPFVGVTGGPLTISVDPISGFGSGDTQYVCVSATGNAVVSEVSCP